MVKQVNIIWVSLLALAGIQAADAQDVKALVGATIIDGKGGDAIKNGVVIVDDDRIICVGSSEACTIPEDAVQHDVHGQFITPGLIDAHVHFGQTGWIDGRPDGIEAPDVYPYDKTLEALRGEPDRWHRAYLCSGVTAVFDVGGADWTVTDPHATDTDRADRVHVLAAGPLITHGSARNRFYLRGSSTQRKFLPMDSDAQVREHVSHLKEIGSAAIKVWFLTPPPERREELEARLMLVGDLAREADLPLIVHATGLREAKAALRAGAYMLVHSVQDKPIDNEFLDLLATTKAVYAPTLVVGAGWSRAMASVAFEKPVEIDDPNNCVDSAIMERIIHPARLTEALDGRLSVTDAMARLERVGSTLAMMQANLRTVIAAGGHVVLATDAGNPLTVHGPSVYWEMEAMQDAGMAPGDIITAATLNGARAMGLEDEIGTLTAGKMADLIVIAQDPRIDIAHFRSLTHVMRKGVLRSQHDLKVRP